MVSVFVKPRRSKAASPADTQAGLSKRATQLSPGAALPALCLLQHGSPLKSTSHMSVNLKYFKLVGLAVCRYQDRSYGWGDLVG